MARLSGRLYAFTQESLPLASVLYIDNDNKKKTCDLLEPTNKSPKYSGKYLMLSPFCRWPSLNNLSLKEAELVPAGLSKETITSATSDDKDQSTQAFKKFSGLNLKNRDLRFADLSQAVLPGYFFCGRSRTELVILV
jgi:uncharacterized protein YjbI with pentapeptide repeats